MGESDPKPQRRNLQVPTVEGTVLSGGWSCRGNSGDPCGRMSRVRSKNRAFLSGHPHKKGGFLLVDSKVYPEKTPIWGPTSEVIGPSCTGPLVPVLAVKSLFVWVNPHNGWAKDGLFSVCFVLGSVQLTCSKLTSWSLR